MYSGPQTGLAKIQITYIPQLKAFVNIYLTFLYPYLSHSIVGLNIAT